MLGWSLVSFVVIASTIVVLLYAAVIDLRYFTIPNAVIVLLGLLYFIYAGLNGEWTQILWHFALACLIFAFLLIFYWLGHVGGGDVKLLTVAFLWTGIDYALVFSIVLLVLAMLVAGAAKLGWLKAAERESDGRLRIAFAPSIAGALIVVVALESLTR